MDVYKVSKLSTPTLTGARRTKNSGLLLPKKVLLHQKLSRLTNRLGQKHAWVLPDGTYLLPSQPDKRTELRDTRGWIDAARLFLDNMLMAAELAPQQQYKDIYQWLDTLSNAAGRSLLDVPVAELSRAIYPLVKQWAIGVLLQPFTSTHPLVVVNCFQVDGHAISTHTDTRDRQLGINISCLLGNFKLGHLRLPIFNTAIEVRPGQALSFKADKLCSQHTMGLYMASEAHST